MLAAHGRQLRVLTRNRHKADELRAVGVDVVVGDVRAPAAAAAAVADCTTVISAVHGFIGPRGVNPVTVDRDGNRTLISAAVNAGVEHLVLVSAYGAGPDHPMSLHRMKYAAEQSLMDSGLEWTIIRPVPFIETWMAVIGAHLADRNKALVLGRGDNPINMVSVRDVVTAIDRAVEDDALRGQILEVVGPACLTMRHIAEQLIATTARPGRITQVPLAVLRIMSVLAMTGSAQLRPSRSGGRRHEHHRHDRRTSPPGPRQPGSGRHHAWPAAARSPVPWPSAGRAPGRRTGRRRRRHLRRTTQTAPGNRGSMELVTAANGQSRRRADRRGD